MSETTVTAIVLRRTDLGESDRLLTLLTRELGKVDAVAKGARKGGSRLAGISEPLMFAELHLARTRSRHYVTQAQPMSSLPALRQSYERLLCGLAMTELVALHLPYESEQPEVFDVLTAALAALGGDCDPAVPLVWFGSRMLKLEGQMPDWRICAATGVPLKTTPVWYSSAAGGAVSEAAAHGFADARLASAVALIAIAKSAELERPPAAIKRAPECCEVLFRFWQGVAESPLPAWGAAVQTLKGDGE